MSTTTQVSPRPRPATGGFPLPLLFVACLSGCMSAPQAQPPSAPATPPSNAVAAPPAQSGGSALSYGTVTSTVEKGKTTQLDLIQLFGGPNISTVDGEGVET